MAHSGAFATKAQCDAKAGEFVDATGWTEANINDWNLIAESRINAECEHNYTDDFAGLDSDVKYLLSDAASNLVAIYGINYNPTITQIGVIETMLNTLRDHYMQCIKLLKNKEVQAFMEKV